MNLVCALFRYFPHGGLQKDFLRIAEEAVRRGHKVTLVCGDCSGELPPEVKVVKLPLKSHTNHGRAAEFEQLFPAAAAGADLKLGFNRIANLDFYFAGDDCLKRHALKKYPKFFLKFAPRYRIFLSQEKSVLGSNSGTKIFAIATAQKKDFIRFYNTPEERLIEIPPGIDEQFRENGDLAALRIQCRRELEIQDEEFLLIQIASSFSVKGIDRTIRAIGAQPQDYRERCKFLLLGDLDRSALRSVAEKSGIDPQNLLLPGAVTDVKKYLAGADLMIHPARKESAGAVLTEAVATGVPVLCSGACGFAPFVQNAGGLVLSEPFGQGYLNTALFNILSGELEQMKVSARKSSLQCDFFRRAAVVVDALEAACKC